MQDIPRKVLLYTLSSLRSLQYDLEAGLRQYNEEMEKGDNRPEEKYEVNTFCAGQSLQGRQDNKKEPRAA